MMIDWIVKRSIRSMFSTYFRARAQQATHRDALWAIVRFQFAKEPDRATTFWQNHWRGQSKYEPLLLPGETQEDAELKTLIDLLLHAVGGHKALGMDFYTLIADIYENEVKDEIKPGR